MNYCKVTTLDNYSALCNPDRVRIGKGWKKLFLLKYRKGVWIYPKIKGSKILVFGSKSAAIGWAWPGERVWLCDVKNPVYIKSVLFFGQWGYGVRSPGKSIVSHIKRFWGLDESKRRISSLSTVSTSNLITACLGPGAPNVYACDAVRITEILKELPFDV